MPLDLPASLQRAVRSGDITSCEHVLLRTKLDHASRLAIQADLKRQSGELGEALTLARSLRQSSSNSAVVVFALRVEGEALGASGQVADALALLDRVIAEGEPAREHQQIALAALSRFTILTSHQGLIASQQALSTAKRAVLRCGDAQLLAGLHARVGQAHAQRSLASLALRELESALALLKPEPNFAIQGFVELALSGVEYLLARSDEALRWAREARRTADTNGLRSLRASAQANLAFLELRRGRLSFARRAALASLTDVPPLSLARGALLDTLANIAVEKGDIDGAGIYVGQINELIRVLNRATLLLVDSAAVRARVAQAMGDWAGSHRILSEAIDVAASRGDQMNWAKLTLLRSEVGCRNGEFDAVDSDILGVIERVQEPSAEVLGLLARARAVRALSRRDQASAKTEFSRAERVFASSGERFLRRQAARLATETAVPNEVLAAPLAVPRRRPSTRFAEELSFVCGLLPHPHIAGMELCRMLRRLEVVTSASVEEIAGDTSHDSRLVIPLGALGSLSIQVRLEPRSDATSRETLSHVSHVIRRAVAGVRAQSESKRRVLSWDLDVAPEGQEGLYISNEMKRLLKTIRRVAVSDVPVLVCGETGTGKEIVANELHAVSRRASRPFIALNVAAVPRDMLEGQLFGYRRGAFTGAVADAKGLIREAEGGTLFIDEIGDLSHELQPKLLRFLESGEIQPLGERPQRVDVRIVAATNARLETLVKEGRFREDLFYRLNVVSLTVPPLRERREEIPTLIHHFLTRHAHEAGKLIPQLTPRALERLSTYDWPGNVRQLTNELKRVVAMADDDELVDLEHLAPGIRDADEEPAKPPSDGSTVTLNLDRDFQALYDDLERAAITRAMAMAHQNQSESARRLGITRKGLYLKRKRLGLPVDAAEEAEVGLTPAR